MATPFDFMNPKDRLAGLNKATPKPQGVATPKQPLVQRAGQAIAKRPGMLKSAFGTLALPAGLLLDRNDAPEDRIFPKAGGVLDTLDQRAEKAYQEEGILPALGEVGDAFFPAIGGAMLDVKDYVGGLFSDGTPQPDAAPETTKPIVPPTPAANGPAVTQVALPTAPAPEPEGPRMITDNDSYFINNQTGRAPGERQYFRDIQAGFPEQESRSNFPIRPSADQGSQYVSPVAEAKANLRLPQFSGNDSFGQLMGKRLELNNAMSSLIPASALEKQMAERRSRDVADRDFGLDALTLDSDISYKQAGLDQTTQQMGETRRRTDLDRLARMRGQDKAAQARIATSSNAGPLSFEDQAGRDEAIRELAQDRFMDAPAQFASTVPDLIRQVGSVEPVRQAYDKAIAAQAKFQGVSPSEVKVDEQKLYDSVIALLGLGQ